jgi:hypothetical protein
MFCTCYPFVQFIVIIIIDLNADKITGSFDENLSCFILRSILFDKLFTNKFFQ